MFERVIGVSVLLVFVFAPAGFSAGIPEVLEGFPGQASPLWVELGTALDSDGGLNPDLYPIGPRRVFHKWISMESAKANDGCVSLGRIVDFEAARQPRSLTSVARESDRIARMLVTDREIGLNGQGHPTTLFRVEPIEVVRGRAFEQDAYFFAFPVAELVMGDKLFCKTDERFPRLPEVGEEVFVFFDNRDVWVDSFINLTSEPGLVILGRSGFVELAAQFLEVPDDNLSTERSVTELSRLIRGLGEEDR